MIPFDIPIAIYVFIIAHLVTAPKSLILSSFGCRKEPTYVLFRFPFALALYLFPFTL